MTYTAPWLERITRLQASAAINDDAEKRVAALNEEMKDLVREMRVKDQSYQESTVKISIMEKRMEGVKKQTEMITELENELISSKKSEKISEEALDTTRFDLEKAQSELMKLKAGGAIEKGSYRFFLFWKSVANLLFGRCGRRRSKLGR